MKQKRVAVVLAGVLAIMLATFGAGYAILFGEPDGDAHPYVGMMVADVGGVPAWRCSGTLIAPDVFLTAGHCVYGADAARVWFDTDLTDNAEYPYGGATSFEGVPVPHPNFAGALTLPNTSDVGVVLLTESPPSVGFGALPAIGLAEDLNSVPGADAMVNIVGYGLQLVKPELTGERVRYQATPMLVELNSSIAGGWNLHLSSNPGKGGGTGGACSGDSGGPALAATDSNVVVGVGSFVFNPNCMGVGYYYRVDTEYAQDFINQFLP